MELPIDQRPGIIALAGPNGAGKTTFYHAHLQAAALRFVNADVLGRELDVEPYAAARLADSIRRTLVEQRESFVFETVFSDPVGDKLAFLKGGRKNGLQCDPVFHWNFRARSFRRTRSDASFTGRA